MKNTSSAQRLVALCGMLGLAACEAPEHEFDKPLGFSANAPIATNEALVHVDDAAGGLLFILPRDEGLEYRHQRFAGERERIAWARPSRDGSLVLSLSVPADEKQEEVEETLWISQADGKGAPRQLVVESAYDGMALTPDWKHAVLYFQGQSSAQIQNANQVAIVDLESDTDPRSLSLNGFGGQLQRIAFPAQIAEGESISVSVGGVERDLAAFMAASELVLIDMADADANQLAVDFADAPGFSPEGTLLRPGDELSGGAPTLFIRSSGSQDIFMLTLLPKSDEEGFTTTNPNLLYAGQGVRDFVYHNEGDQAFLVAARQSELMFMDINTTAGFPVDMGGPVSRVYLRDHLDGDISVRQAVAWDPGANFIHTLELDNIQSTIGREPDHLKIEQAIQSVVQLDNDRALVTSGMHLFLVNFSDDQITPMQTKSLYESHNAYVQDGLLLLGSSTSPYISTVDLANLNPESMLLDAQIENFFYLPKSNKVVATHSSQEGDLTVAQANDPARSTSYRAWGYLAEARLEVGR